MLNSYKQFCYEDFNAQPIRQHQELVEELCKNLYEQFHINYFFYQRRFEELVLLEITNSNHWGLRYCAEYLCDESLKEYEIEEDGTQVYQIPPCISFVRTNGEFRDRYAFSTSLAQTRGIYSLLMMREELIKFGDDFVLKIDELLADKRISAETFDKDYIHKKIILDDFKPKEIKILALLAADFNTTQVAHLVHMEVKSVQKIINRLRDKLHCDTRTGLVAKAIALGIVDDVTDIVASPLLLIDYFEE